MKHKVKHIHFVGVGGSGHERHRRGAGPSGISTVRGRISRPVPPPVAWRRKGEKVMIGHAADHVAGPTPWSFPPPVKADNLKCAARDSAIPVVPAPRCWPS